MLQIYLSVLVNTVLSSIAVQKCCPRAALRYKPQCTNHIIGVFIFHTNIMKFTPNMRQNETFQITYQNKLLTGTNNTKFLGLELDKNVNWKNHIQKILPKLSSACYLIRRMYLFCNLNTMRMIYLAYFHSVMEYGIIFWGVSVESKRILLQKKRILRIMTGSLSRATCRKLFCELKILTLTSQYILSLMRFLSSNLDIFHI
jgi:hypothetical protein